MADPPSFPSDIDEVHRFLEAVGADKLPGTLDMHIDVLEHGRAVLSLDIGIKHFASNGYLHAGTVVSLADTAAGYGCVASRPDGVTGFTTIELKANFLGTALSGRLEAEAEMVHGGRTTQVWDAQVRRPDGKTIGLFRCTQMLLR